MTGCAPLTSQHVLTLMDPQQNSGVDTPKEGISSMTLSVSPFLKKKQIRNPNHLNRNSVEKLNVFNIWHPKPPDILNLW